MSDDVPDAPKIVKEAIQNKTSISDIAGRHTGTSKAKNRVVVRVYRYLKRMPGGEKLKEYLLNDRSWYRLNAAARLVAPALKNDSPESDSDEDNNEDPILDLIAEGGVPIVSLSRGSEDKRNTYSYWYMHISRNRPTAIDYVLGKEAPSLQLGEDDRSEGGGSTQYFDITTHEFGSVAQ